MTDDAKSDGKGAEEPDWAEILKLLRRFLGSQSPWYPLLGKVTVGYILVTLGILAIEMTYGVPIVTLANAPIVGAIVIFLWGSIEAWVMSGKPDVFFYACPGKNCPRESPYIRLEWASLPKYKKLKACHRCGERLIKRCQSGRHLLLPAPDAPDGAEPDRKAICPRCPPHLSLDERRYLPGDGERVHWYRKVFKAPWRQRYQLVKSVDPS